MGSTIDEGRHSSPVPWVGFYITAASIACLIAMLVDFIQGICHGKPWYPCKFFSLNATSLMLLAIATKLPTDINTEMPGIREQFTKLSGNALLCIAMGNFMPSLGAMEDTGLILNVVPLGILVITAFVDTCIQIYTGLIYTFLPGHIKTLSYMLILLLFTCSSALMVRPMKLNQQRELKQHQLSCDGLDDEVVMSTVSKLKTEVKKYWMVARSCNPQYALCSCCLGTASDVFCFWEACVLISAFLAIPKQSLVHVCPSQSSSDYKCSVTFILFSQLFAVVVGALAPLLRTFSIVYLVFFPGNFQDDPTIGLQESNGEIQVETSRTQRLVGRKERMIIGFREFLNICISWIKKFVIGTFKVERYWIQNFMEWKDSPLPFDIRSKRWRRLIHGYKNGILEVIKWLHIAVVIFSKLTLHLMLLPSLIIACIPRLKIKKLVKQAIVKMITEVCFHLSSLIKELVDPPGAKRELIDFILHIRGMGGFTDANLLSCHWNAEQWIQKGRKKSPTHLANLLKTAIVWPGFRESVPLACTEEPHNCWALPLVTLTSIAVAIPCSGGARTKSLLLEGVGEGLKYVRLVDKKLDSQGQVNNREAADIVWLGVDLHRQWLDVDLAALAPEETDPIPTNVIQRLAEFGKSNFVVEFEKRMANVRGDGKKGLEWSPRALACIFMQKICETILRNYSHLGPSEWFDWLHVLISDMLGACLTNLPRALSLECYSSAIEGKEDGIREAACLLGEAENILEALGKEWGQDLVINQSKYIDHWRSFMLILSALPSPISTGNISIDELCIKGKNKACTVLIVEC